jgi:hypothetical protein
LDDSRFIDTFIERHRGILFNLELLLTVSLHESEKGGFQIAAVATVKTLFITANKRKMADAK